MHLIHTLIWWTHPHVYFFFPAHFLNVSLLLPRPLLYCKCSIFPSASPSFFRIWGHFLVSWTLWTFTPPRSTHLTLTARVCLWGKDRLCLSSESEMPSWYNVFQFYPFPWDCLLYNLCTHLYGPSNVISLLLGTVPPLFVISWYLLHLDLASCFSRALQCIVRLFACDPSDFWMWALKAMNFPGDTHLGCIPVVLAGWTPVFHLSLGNVSCMSSLFPGLFFFKKEFYKCRKEFCNE